MTITNSLKVYPDEKVIENQEKILDELSIIQTRDSTLAKALRGEDITCGIYWWNNQFQGIDGLSAIKKGEEGVRTSQRTGMENTLVKCIEHALYGKGDRILYTKRYSNTRIEGVYNTNQNATKSINEIKNSIGVYDFLLAGTSVTQKRTIHQKALYGRTYFYTGQRVVLNSNSFTLPELDSKYSLENPPTFKEYIDALYKATLDPDNNTDKKYRLCTCSIGTTCEIDIVNFIKRFYPNVTNAQLYGVVEPGLPDYEAEEKDRYTRVGMIRRLSNFDLCFTNTVNGDCAGTLRDTAAFYGFFDSNKHSNIVSVDISDETGAGKNLNNDELAPVFRQNDQDMCNLYNLIIYTLLTAYKIGLGRGSKHSDLDALNSKVAAADYDLFKKGTPFELFGIPGKRAFEIVTTFGNMYEITQEAEQEWVKKKQGSVIKLWSGRNQLAEATGISLTNTENEKGCYTLELYGFIV